MSRLHRASGSLGWSLWAHLCIALLLGVLQAGCVCGAWWVSDDVDAGMSPSGWDAGRPPVGNAGGGTSVGGGAASFGGGSGAVGGGSGAVGGGSGAVGGGSAGGDSASFGGGPESASADGGSGSSDGGGDAGTPEVCDGVDNDGDGVIDNVDLGADGICDCLRVGVIGFSGLYGSGDVATDWLPSRTSTAPVSLGGQVLTDSVLAPFEVLIVEDVRAGTAGQSGRGKGIGRTFSGTEVDALTRWVQAGGGVVMLTGYADAAEVGNSNLLLAPFALSFGADAILWNDVVTHWAAHPIAAGLDSIPFANGHAALGSGVVVAWQPTPGAYDVGRAAENGSGRVFIWGDEHIAYALEWSASSQTARLWMNLLRWLSGPQYCQVPPPP